MHSVLVFKLDKAAFRVGVTGGRWGRTGVKVMLSGRRTIGKDRGGTEDKKHNKKHHLFVRMLCCNAPLKCIGFSSCFISCEQRREAGESEGKTERVTSTKNFFFLS